MLKLSHDNAIKTTLMFWVDEQIESKYESIYEKEMPKYDSVLSIRNQSELQDFIRKECESIKLLTTVLGISSEKFKRVITLLRVRKGYIVTTEWSDSKVRDELCKNQKLMDEFCDLFFKQSSYQDLIPRAILKDFRLDREWLIHVCARDMLLKMIKTSYSTAYNTECANAYQEAISDKIRGYSDKYGLTFEKNTDIIKAEELQIITNGEKSIIVTISYTVTTSNNQTRYATKIQSIRSAIAGNDNHIMINILDGAGWIARGSDYQKIHTDCNYFLNLANIDNIEKIIIDHFNIQ